MHGTEIRVMRIFNTCGLRMLPDDGRGVSNFIAQALKCDPLTLYGDGSQTCSFCFVDYLIEGMTRVMNSHNCSPINIENPAEFSIRHLAELVWTKVSSALELIEKPLPQDDPLQREPVIAHALQELAWKPTVLLEQGLDATIDYFRKLLASSTQY